MVVKIKLLKPDAKIPARATKGSSGYDLFAAEDILIPARSQGRVPLGFAVQLQEHYEMVIYPRSGMSLRGQPAIIGTIDSDYRGEVSVILDNNTDTPFQVKAGDRIAQAKIQSIPHSFFIEVDELSQTQRGEGGFGHTGTGSFT